MIHFSASGIMSKAMWLCRFHAASRINAAPKPHCCTPINIANMVHTLLWTRHYILLSAVCVQFWAKKKKQNTFVQLTSKLQAGSPAEDRSDCIERHTLVQPRVLVAVQAAYNEVAPRQTPSAIQAQIYESPIQWPSVRAKTPSVPGNAHCSILPSNQGGLTGVGNGKASPRSKLERREMKTLHIFANVEAFKCTLEAANSTWDWRAHVF